MSAPGSADPRPLQMAFPEAGHDHAACVEWALGSASGLCHARGVKLTELRRRVLETVWRSHQPIGAYDILESLSAERGRVAPPTVYRALDFLAREGLVHRVDTLNAFVGCRTPEHPHEACFLICRGCRMVAEVQDEALHRAVTDLAAPSGFTVASATVELSRLVRRLPRPGDGGGGMIGLAARLRRLSVLLTLLPVLAGTALVGAGDARAHPHVWIDARLTFRFEEERLTKLELAWTFDELFTGWVLEQGGPDAAGAFDPAASARIEAEAFATLAELGYLTRLRVDGEAIALDRYEGFAVSVENGRLAYRFTLPLPQPIDPRLQGVRVGLYDESFYIDVVLAENEPVALAGAAPPGCAAVLAPDEANPIYFGAIVPIVADLRCTAG